MHITACIVTFRDSNTITHVMYRNRGWNIQSTENQFKFKAQVQLFAKDYVIRNP